MELDLTPEELNELRATLSTADLAILNEILDAPEIPADNRYGDLPYDDVIEPGEVAG